MFRYAIGYKQRWACFHCRKAFKQMDDARPLSLGLIRHTPVCPECKLSMHCMGRDFKAPPRSDIKQWKKVEVLFANGFAFHSCGCCGPGRRPKRLREVSDFLKEDKRLAAAQQRAMQIEERARELKAQRNRRKKIRARKLEFRALQNQSLM